MLKQFQIALTLAVLCATPTVSWAARSGGGSASGSVNRNVNTNTNVNRNVNVNNNVNVNRNVNVNTNVNVNRNVNVNTNVNVNHYGYGGGGCCYYAHPAYTAAAIVATAVVVGSIVNSLPAGCTTIYRNGFAYQQCGSTYYQPQFSGSSTTYIVVNGL
jgi:UDP-3-O-[3-hydroxymyristoyl] glucosamine N-acyltransferase